MCFECQKMKFQREKNLTARLTVKCTDPPEKKRPATTSGCHIVTVIVFISIRMPLTAAPGPRSTRKENRPWRRQTTVKPAGNLTKLYITL